ncbi:S-(hydroxymethyl)glutathione dehydrogenase / alcohol dehydrogenase [Chitinophaga costaii]|uniref:S-(Hydroxymethyl)glutathione dehydrogenase / alcohol dehydrogenase n=1 Tax=Chitinophaga costaii TaxID=1335309 RepID=A0A1C4F2G6_9BACT|nr:Zn-dependent alcohol dehydrogenase [Chitinophaga costaii]PUZ22124.1 alcohol dehydrogenase [Chitinophaga costaii]SCC50044.1 S-(hydroxymethyl)glutathione dehydrogenase / alcohol dehydrogenase [Chitinophaga costaii]
MKASIVKEIGGKFQTADIEIDKPKGSEVLISVKASGLCHSDLHIRDHSYGYAFPAVLGHEPAGVVEAIGEDVTEFQVGDHVVGCLIQFCGKCEECLSGRTYLCQHPEYTLRKEGESPRLQGADKSVLNQGFGLGGFAEKILVHEHQLAKVPKEMPFDKACLLGCGTVTGAGAIINSAKIRPGDSVAVIGTGGVGLNAISGAKIAGATTIIAIDIDDEKLAFSKKFGATHTINSSKENPVAKVKEITEGGVTAAFEVIGLKATSEQALEMIKRGGSAYLIGMAKPGTVLSVKTFEEMLANAKNLVGVMMGSSNLKRDIPMYAKLYLEGRMNLDDLVYKQININQVEEAYQELASGKIIGRSVITSFN